MSEPRKPKTQKAPAFAWPADCKQLEAAGYRLEYTRKCKLCEASIEFWRTPAAKYIPLDRRLDGRRVPHHSTCPRADEFRQKSKQQNLFGDAK